MKGRIKKGDTVTMLFHYAGLVTEEHLKVVRVSHKKGTIMTWDGSTNWTFDAKTGKCLNDNTWGDARRTLKLEG